MARGLQAIERFHSEAVAREQDRPLPMIINGQREDAVELAEHVLAPTKVGGQQDFGVAAGTKLIPVRQLITQFTEVINLPVEHDCRPPGRIGHRLRRRGAEILDREPGLGQPQPSFRSVEAA